MKHILTTSVAISLLTTAMAADKDNFTSSPKTFPDGRTPSMVHQKIEYERTLASPTKEWYEAIPTVVEVGEDTPLQPQLSMCVEEHMEPRRKRPPLVVDEVGDVPVVRRKAPPAIDTTGEIVPRRAGTIAKHPTIEMPRIAIPLRQESVVIPTAPSHDLSRQDAGSFSPVEERKAPNLEDYVEGRVASFTGKPRSAPPLPRWTLAQVPSAEVVPLTKEEASEVYDGE